VLPWLQRHWRTGQLRSIDGGKQSLTHPLAHTISHSIERTYTCSCSSEPLQSLALSRPPVVSHSPRLARPCSHSCLLDLAHLLTRLPSRCLTLNITRSHSLALACAWEHSFTLARPHLSTCWLAFICLPVGSHSLELTHSHTLACPHWLTNAELTHSQALSNSLAWHCQTIQCSLFFSNKCICYVNTTFCGNILIGVGDIIAKRNSKECPLWLSSTSGSNFYTWQSFGTFICVTVQNVSEIGLSTTEL